jgi:hypothetical protein
VNENWWMAILGVALIVGGFTFTHVSGAMPGARPSYPMPLRMRVILIAFGVLWVILGVTRLVRE